MKNISENFDHYKKGWPTSDKTDPKFSRSFFEGSKMFKLRDGDSNPRYDLVPCKLIIKHSLEQICLIGR